MRKALGSRVRSAKTLIRGLVRSLGYEVRELQPTDGFGDYVQSAQAAGQDVNDWIEKTLGWEAGLPLMEAIVSPHLREDSVVCEIGSGTGRQARHIPQWIPKGRLYLFDRSPWCTAFMKDYFKDQANVEVCFAQDGCSLSLPGSSVDFLVSTGTFVALKLGTILLYAREARRVLRPGGRIAFNFIDIDLPRGREFLEAQAEEFYDTYTFHSLETLKATFEPLGLDLEESRHDLGKGIFRWAVSKKRD